MADGLKFKRDHHLRRRLFAEASFEHKARMNLYWLAWLLDQHTRPGEMVLDPMGGAGSILLACHKGRPVLSGDVELYWARLQKENACRSLLGAPAGICQWDAGRLPVASGLVPAIVTSPPYFDMFSNWNRTSGRALAGRHVSPAGNCYGFSASQLGNIHVYENYLRAMRGVYRECWRVLRPGGILVLVVGDRVKRKRLVPIVDNTATLCWANGFKAVSVHERATIPSQFRRIHSSSGGADYPTIDTETALVFEKEIMPARQKPFRYAIVQAPRPNSLPGQQLFGKVLAHASLFASLLSDLVLVLTRDKFIPLDQAKRDFGGGHLPNLVWSGDHAKARMRKDWSFEAVRDLVIQWGLGAGDEVELHVSAGYARYLERRLTTFGARVTNPTSSCNFGQKLRWYTEALDAGGQRSNLQ